MCVLGWTKNASSSQLCGGEEKRAEKLHLCLYVVGTGKTGSKHYRCTSMWRGGFGLG